MTITHFAELEVEKTGDRWMKMDRNESAQWACNKWKAIENPIVQLSSKHCVSKNDFLPQDSGVYFYKIIQ